MSYTTAAHKHGLGIDKEALLQAKEDAKQRAITIAKAKAVAKAQAKSDALKTKMKGAVVYAPQPSRHPDVLSDDEAKAIYDTEWAATAGRAVPSGAEPPAGGGPAAAEGPPVGLIAGGLLAAAAGIYILKKRTGR